MSFKCHKCGKLFTCRSNLNAHINKRTPCITEANDNDTFKCEFCNNGFSLQSSLKRHKDRCVVRKNPELLLKYIEQQKELTKEIIAQKDKLIEQQIATIEKMQVNKTLHIEGNENTIHVDNSQHVDNSKHIDKSTNNIHINMSYTFRAGDMKYLLQELNQRNDPKFITFAKDIYTQLKACDLNKMIFTLISYLHDNEDIKQGQVLRYCNDGEHKGELLVHDCDSKGNGFWRPTDISTVLQVLSKEFASIHNQRLNKSVSEPCKMSEKCVKVSDDSMRLDGNPKNQKFVRQCIKDMNISKTVPEDIVEHPDDEDIFKEDVMSEIIHLVKQRKKADKSVDNIVVEKEIPQKSSKSNKSSKK